jgi:hypothetical protein
MVQSLSVSFVCSSASIGRRGKWRCSVWNRHDQKAMIIKITPAITKLTGMNQARLRHLGTRERREGDRERQRERERVC